MFQVPDPAWKRNPDIVADESFDAVYGDESEDRYSGLLIDDEEDIEND